MRLLAYLKRQRSLIAEIESLRAENAQLRYDLATAWLVSWIRRRDPSPKALLLPKSEAPQAIRHPVHPGRHRIEEPTEVHPRIRRTP